MKITIQQIKSLIKEELNKVLYEVTVEDFEKAEGQLEEGMGMLLGLKTLLGLGTPIEYKDTTITQNDYDTIVNMFSNEEKHEKKEKGSSDLIDTANIEFNKAAKQLKIYKTDDDEDGKYDLDGYIRDDRVEVILDVWREKKNEKVKKQKKGKSIDGELDQNISGTSISDEQIEMLKTPQYTAKMVKKVMDSIGENHPKYQQILKIYKSKSK